MSRFVTSVAAALLVFAAPGSLAAGEFNAVMNIGDPMPGFEALPAVDGGTLSDDDLDARVVVLVSLANHCPWVQGMDAGLVSLVREFEGEDVQIVGFAVNHREDDRLPAMIEHARRVGYKFPYVFDESQALGRALGATRTPEYFVFDAERKLVYMGLLHNSPARMTSDGTVRHINGEPDEFYVAKAIRATLAGQVVETPETRAHGCTVKYES